MNDVVLVPGEGKDSMPFGIGRPLEPIDAAIVPQSNPWTLLLPGDQQPDGATHHYYCHHGDREWGIGVAGGHEADMPARAQTSGGVGCRASLDCSQRAPNKGKRPERGR